MLPTRIFCHFETLPKCIGMSFFCVWSMDHRTAWNEWKMLWDAEISVFTWLYGVFNPVDTIHLFLWEKIVPSGIGVMASLWIQTAGFGVCLWQSFNNSPVHLSNNQRQRMTLKIWFLLDKYTHCFQKTKQCQNSIVRDENTCFSVYWNCLKIFLHVSWTV